MVLFRGHLVQDSGKYCASVRAMKREIIHTVKNCFMRLQHCRKQHTRKANVSAQLQSNHTGAKDVVLSYSFELLVMDL